MNFLNQTQRGLFRKNGNVINRFKRRQDAETIFLEVDRAAGAFDFSHGRIRVKPHDQDITETLCLFKIGDMTDVEDIETTVCEDDLLSLGAASRDNPPQGVSRLDLIAEGGQDFRQLPRGREEP